MIRINFFLVTVHLYTVGGIVSVSAQGRIYQTASWAIIMKTTLATDENFS
jgi:hypothetical protein